MFKREFKGKIAGKNTKLNSFYHFKKIRKKRVFAAFTCLMLNKGLKM